MWLVAVQLQMKLELSLSISMFHNVFVFLDPSNKSQNILDLCINISISAKEAGTYGKVILRGQMLDSAHC